MGRYGVGCELENGGRVRIQKWKKLKSMLVRTVVEKSLRSSLLICLFSTFSVHFKLRPPSEIHHRDDVAVRKSTFLTSGFETT
jgi:hypothetical protein